MLSAEIPSALSLELLQWLKNIFHHFLTVPSLLTAIKTFLKLCIRLNLCLHPAKCILLAHSVRWCACLIDAQGWRFDPKNMESFKDMSVPTTGANLQQFVCNLNWIRMIIPDYVAIIAPLLDLMEKVYTAARKRTRRGVECIHLAALCWIDQEQ